MISENSTRFSRSTRAAIAAVVFSAPAVVSLVPARAVAQPAAEKAAVSAGGEMTASRKKNDIGIRGHGFVQDNNVLTTIDVPGATTFSLALGTNEAGQTVGAYVDKKGRVHGFLRDSGGNFTPIDFPGAAATVAWKINALGQVVGAYSEDAGSPAFDLHHGFLLDKGVFTTIDVPGALQTQPHAINNRGQIVGEYLDSTGKYHGFLLDGGVFTTIDAPGGTSTQAYDIDDSGRIVGISFNVANLGNPMGSTVRGFLRDAQGAFTAIEAPGTTQTQPLGINNTGQIVGVYDAEGRPRGFLLDQALFTTIDVTDPLRGTIVVDINDHGQLTGAFDLVTHGYVRDRRGDFTTIDHPDAVEITQPFWINNRGQIVGHYNDAAGTKHAFLRDGDGFTTIDFPGAPGSEVRRINDAGQIVGHYSTLGNRVLFPARGYLLDHGVVTPIDVPGALHTQPGDIDNSGRIVGEYQDAAGMFHGFLRDPSGAFTTIDVPGAVATSIVGMNDEGWMVGLYIDGAGVGRSFLRDPGGTFTTIDVPGATLTLARDINNAGEVVGSFGDEAAIRGFILSQGTFTTIDVPDNVLGTHASGIDDRGRIVGIRD